MPGLVKVSEAASIAIHAMVLMAANPGRMLSAKEIAGVFNLSNAHLAKVMQRLVKTGLVVSTRGPAGGFRLSRDPEKLSLREILEAIEGPLDTGNCLLDPAVCPGGLCFLGEALANVNRQVLDMLEGQDLAHLTSSYLERHNGASAA
ncbi:MAG: Rrf2 family transcriptional regulator [Deltaproteobacteria bacterium]|nr:Rrf2 family transcriptional regulator [Deltaproteobacteria bacterium]